MKKPNEIEDQILTVYHFWYAEGINGEHFQRYLFGLFELVKEKFPDAAAKARADANVKSSGAHGQEPTSRADK